jgi:phosphatidylglycerol lysyltransferase
MPKFRNLHIDLPAIVVGLSGIIALLSIPVKTLGDDIYSWLPFNPYRLAHVTALILGLGLIYLASQLKRKKISALIATSVILLFLIGLEILGVHQIPLGLLYAASLVLLLSQRSHYVVRNDLTSLRRSLLISGVLMGTVIVFSILTFDRIDQRAYGRDLETSQTIRITVNAMLGEELPSYVHPTRRDRALLFSLQASSIIILGIVFAGLFYPVRLRRGSSRRSRLLAEHILEKHGGSSEDFLKLWPQDKHYYFYRDSFLAYGVSRGTALVLDGPSGDKANFEQLRRHFIEECRINGWNPAIMHAGESEKQAWEQLGFSGLYLGSEARVNIAEFCESTYRNKHFRYVKNKAEKENLEVRELQQPLSDSDLRQLRRVSDQWLDSGRREYRFVMGYFDPAYLRRCRIFVLIQDGRIAAYTNLLPEYQSKQASIDHMRFADGISGAGMHYLLMNTIFALKDEAPDTLNLGLAPLSKLDENTQNLSKSVLQVVRSVGRRYYSFAGLEQFKNKFEPAWEPTYLIYGGMPNRLAAIGAAVSSLTAYQKPDRRNHAVLILAATIGACYASFPLAIYLNPSQAWSTVVSTFGEAGQPFSWVFNSLDIISSLLGITLMLLFLRYAHGLDRLLRYGVISLLIGNMGGVLAATLALPDGVELDGRLSWELFDNLGVVIHMLVSTINSGGFLVALLLWTAWSFRKFGKNWRMYFTAIILILDIAGFIIGQSRPDIFYITQRIFIAGYAVWLVMFTRDVMRK